MSYTPEDQQIELPLNNLIKALDSFRDVALNRLKDPTEWNSEHLNDLRRVLIKTNELELELTKLL
jgi:hypothetical protein